MRQMTKSKFVTPHCSHAKCTVYTGCLSEVYRAVHVRLQSQAKGDHDLEGCDLVAWKAEVRT